MSRKDLSTDNVTNARTTLDQSVEFRRWIDNKRADAQRSSDRIQAEIETLLAELDSKRTEQREQDEIVTRCDAALTIDMKANRPAPKLTTRDTPVADELKTNHQPEE